MHVLLIDANSGFSARFLGFSVFISNTTSREDGILCFKDTNFTRTTIPESITIACPYYGRYVIFTTTEPTLHTLLDILHTQTTVCVK